MKFQIHKEDLLGPINTVQKAISGRTPLPILEGIYIQVKDNFLTLMGTDGEISIKSKLPVQVEEEGDLVVNSRLFGEIIRKLPSSMIYFNLEEKNLNIRCQQSEFNILGQSSQEFPPMPEVDNGVKISLPRESLVNSLRATSFAVSLDDLRMALTGVLFDIEEGAITFVALDGYRMALNKLEIPNQEKIQAIVPARACTEIVRLLDESLDTITLELTENYIKINLDKTTFVSKLINGDFFQYKGLVRQDHKLNVELNRKDFVQGLERANLLAKEERANLVKLHIGKDQLSIESNSDIGDVHEVLPCKGEDGDLDIAFNSKYLMEGVKAITEEEIVCHFIDSVNPCILKGKGNEDYIYLVLPVRLAGQ